MHVAMFHGYFLRGTGSNLFVENICKELCKAGHQVTLFCQENSPEHSDFIEKAFEFNSDNSKYLMSHHKETPYRGKCSMYRPNLNGFLPVFVYDQYEDYLVKEFINCSKEEIESYINHNKNAVNSVFQDSKVDLILTNHTIMQPVYVARSNLGMNGGINGMIVHGSCLNFSVKKSELMKNYALEAIANAKSIVFLSQFSLEEFIAFFSNHQGIRDKAIVIPGGVDLNNFSPLGIEERKQQYIDSLIEDLKEKKSNLGRNDDQPKNDWNPDDDIIMKLQTIDFEKESIILYFGKYLWTKGVQVLIAAAPLILTKHPNTRFLLIGYGSTRRYFEAMVETLHNGKQEEYIRLLEHPESFDVTIDKGTSIFFQSLITQLKEPDFAEQYFYSASKLIQSKIVFTGFLEHKYLKKLIPCADVTVAPSIFPEAFGLVAVESLAAGVIPVQTNHSGFSEVIKKYFDEFDDLFDKNTTDPLYLNEDLVLNLANNIDQILSYYENKDQRDRQIIRQRARDVSLDNYSWEGIANKYLSLAK